MSLIEFLSFPSFVLGFTQFDEEGYPIDDSFTEDDDGEDLFEEEEDFDDEYEDDEREWE